jgi:Na+-translocating ferredoxin:NAD+ oxidoreductase subunit G
MSVPQAAEPSSLRLIGTLTVAGLISGLALVGVYELTLPIIEANNARALEAAVLKVLPGSTGMEPLVLRDGALSPAADGGDEDLPTIYLGRDDGGALVGYAIPSQGTGFQDVIKLIYGYDPDRGTIVGMEILESKETPGLGDKIFKDPSFAVNFEALMVLPVIEAVPKGAKTQAHEVDCITGATISSKAVVRILNAGNQRWLPLLPDGDPGPDPEPAQAPAPAPDPEPAQEPTP